MINVAGTQMVLWPVFIQMEPAFIFVRIVSNKTVGSVFDAAISVLVISRLKSFIPVTAMNAGKKSNPIFGKMKMNHFGNTNLMNYE